MVSFVAADACRICMALPAAFTQPGDHFLAEPCRVEVSSYNVGAPVVVCPPARAANALEDAPLCAADLLAEVALRLQAVAVHVLGHVTAKDLRKIVKGFVSTLLDFVFKFTQPRLLSHYTADR